MHQSRGSVLTNGINTTLSNKSWDVVGASVILCVLSRPDAVQPAAPNPHYRVVHFDVSGVDLTNSTLVMAEFRIFRAPNPQARASQQRVEIFQVNDSVTPGDMSQPQSTHAIGSISEAAFTSKSMQFSCNYEANTESMVLQNHPGQKNSQELSRVKATE